MKKFIALLIMGVSSLAYGINLDPETKPLDFNKPIVILDVEQYDRVKELQYINVIKTIHYAPDDLWIVPRDEKPDGIGRTDWLKHKLIDYILNNDAEGYFELSEEFLAKLEKDYGIILVDGIWRVKE